MPSSQPSIDAWDATHVARVIADRQSLARRETEDFLQTFSRQRFDEQRAQWRYDYSSPEAYNASTAAMRQQWEERLGVFALAGRHDAVTTAPFLETETIEAKWLTLPITDTFVARAIYAVPKTVSPPYPLIIAQHGISSAPENIFGLDDPRNLYHGYGRDLVEAGFAVLAPHHITNAAPRARLQRMCLMVGSTLWGLEIGKLRVWLDHVATIPEINTDTVGMWGISLGGAYTQLTTAVETRIQAAVSTAWFNDRLPKMILDDPRYSCFLSTEEEHIFIPGWLDGFGDAELVSLICPRPFMAQTGKADAIAWWPQVAQEFERAQEHYSRLGIAERAAFDLHDGGHEIRVETGIEFLRHWLTR